MPYSVKEMFYSLQGEGLFSGRPAVFVRFAGCNQWSGREQDRKDGCSAWCDTDFVGTDGPGGGKFDAAGLARAVIELWPDDSCAPFVVLTGGEPGLQVDLELFTALSGCSLAIETNGTCLLPFRSDLWITLSPKVGAPVVLLACDEIKLVYPQAAIPPKQWADFPAMNFYLQPLWAPNAEQRQKNLAACVAYCLAHPKWRLSTQLHKEIGLP